ncbi:hypothetical protein FSP39_010048 [Pinctada imbricata]|uniref:Mab-21-like HhH/H2TH-like domain-containing protein n=1 Tax=Pinctada imbricata TaxID=66713 RepID=A0AA88XHJ7_PINIB|nr:hypothetical protein FSP39_010048 [Pinctada imbricata]
MDDQGYEANFNLSIHVYSALCETFGIAEEIALKRVLFETLPMKYPFSVQQLLNERDLSNFPPELREIATSLAQSNKPGVKMVRIVSGSRAEGVSLKSSDVDVMYLYPNIQIVESMQQAKEGVSSIYLLEKGNTRPGFIRIKAPLHRKKLKPYECYHEDAVYVSSTKFKDFIYEHFQKYSHGLWSLNIHGPCVEITSDIGPMDNAYVLTSERWPRDAIGCLHRLHKKKWPSHEVMTEMVKDGCLFVPIGSKESRFEHIEWRVSFSRAEKRLVYAMNHTQLLTYALLKLFLKEKIEQNSEVEGLLCSYFMKTAVFWEIVEGQTKWAPSCFLQCFWVCLGRVLQWIKDENSPNFFIPENNMFFGKTKSRSWKTLIRVVSALYREGFSMIRSIPSIQKRLVKIESPMPKQSTRTQVLLKVFPQLVLIFEENPDDVLEVLKTLQVGYLPEISQFLRMTFLNQYCFGLLIQQCNSRRHNKTQYLNEAILLRAIMYSSTDCVRGQLCLAIYLYMRKRYDKSIKLLHQVRSKLNSENHMCAWRFDQQKYASLGGNSLFIFDGMRKNTTMYFPLRPQTSLPELSDMIRSLENDPGDIQFVPPYVLTLFMLFLCHFWKGESEASYKEALIDLEETLRTDNGHHVNRSKLPMAWHILGIAQEIIGDFKSAYLSFWKTRTFIREAQLEELKSFKKLNKKKLKRISSILS